MGSSTWSVSDGFSSSEMTRLRAREHSETIHVREVLPGDPDIDELIAAAKNILDDAVFVNEPVNRDLTRY